MTVLVHYDDDDDAVVVESFSSGTGIGIGLALLVVLGLVLAVRWGSRVQAWKQLVDGKTPGVQRLFEVRPCERCTFERTTEGQIVVRQNPVLNSAHELLAKKPWGYTGSGTKSLRKTLDTLTDNQSTMLNTLRALDTLQHHPTRMTPADRESASAILSMTDRIFDLRRIRPNTSFTLQDLDKKHILSKEDAMALAQTLKALPEN